MARGNRKVNNSRRINIRQRRNPNNIRMRKSGALRRFKTGSIHEANISRVITAYPVTKTDWLATLAWAGSMAFRLYKTISRVATLDYDSNLADYAVTTNVGQVLLLGPADFAAVSPFVVSCFDDDAAKKMTSFLTYERMSLPHLSVRIFPCVDVSQRAGMYAAYLQPVDFINDTPEVMLDRFSAEYEQVIKHPNVKVGPTSRVLSLEISRRAAPVAPYIEQNKGLSTMPGNYVNRDPWYVLVVAFSDLATKTPNDTSVYSQERASFEIHLKGKLILFNPSPVDGDHITKKTVSPESMVSSRICNLDAKFSTYKFYNYKFTVLNDTKIRDLDTDILNKLDSLSLESDFEIMK